MVVSREGLSRLYEKAKSCCASVVGQVVEIVQLGLGTSFFQYDASLVRDGCFFAAFLLAGENGSGSDVQACLQALNEMRWVFSKSEERIHTVQMIWGARAHGQAHSAESTSPVLGGTPSFSPDSLSYQRKQPLRSLTMPSLSITTGFAARPPSAPSTGLSQDGSWGSTGSGAMHTHSEPATHRSSPIVSRTPPYSSTSQLADVSRASTSKAPLVASSSALLSPQTSAAMRTMQDPYYYSAYGMSIVTDGSSNAAASSLAGPSTSAMHIPSYPDTGFHTDGAVPFAVSSMSRDTTMLTATSTPEDDDEGHFVAESYY